MIALGLKVLSATLICIVTFEHIRSYSLSLQTQKAERLFRKRCDQYESFVALLDDDAKQFITRHESPTAAPNYYLRTKGEAATSMPIKSLTNFSRSDTSASRDQEAVSNFTNVPMAWQCSFTL